MAREYPNDLEKEKKLLSAMMLEGGRIIPEVTAILKPQALYREEHKIIFRAIVNAYNNNPGVPIDILMVEDELERHKELEKVSRLYLFALLEYEFTTARAVKFAQDIKEKARLRYLIESCEEMMYSCYEEQTTAAELVAEFEGKMSKVTSTLTTEATPLNDILKQTYEEAKIRREKGGRLLGLSTGFLDLDRLTGGLKRSDLIILAARPSMGKTALALNIAINAALEVPVGIFSLEMSKIQLGQRILSSESNVLMSAISTGQFEDSEQGEMLDGMSRLYDRAVYIDDTGGLTLNELLMRSRRLKQNHNVGLIVIDYIQLLTTGKSRENRVQEVSEISRGLKMLARELDIPVLALSQLNRGVELRADKRPQLSDLRESGSIEQDADIVMFLYREEYYDRDNADVKNLSEVLVSKNRNGLTGKMQLTFIGEKCTFYNYTTRCL